MAVATMTKKGQVTIPKSIRDALGLHSLDGPHVVASGHRCQSGTALDRFVVDPHDTGTAVAGVATPMRAGQAKMVADVVDEQGSGLDVPGDFFTVDVHRDFHDVQSCPVARATALRSDRMVNSLARWAL